MSLEVNQNYMEPKLGTSGDYQIKNYNLDGLFNFEIIT
jgi:hypothetical protein